MTESAASVRPPSPFYLLIEGRAVYELLSSFVAMPVVRNGHRGDGHPVLTLPGFLASDVSTLPLRRFLDKSGFRARPWKLGRNLGPRNGLEKALSTRLEKLHARHGRKVSLVGWSLGGIYARLLANRHPERVRSVITLGSPFNLDPKANRSWRLFEWTSGQPVDEVEPEKFRQIRATPPVPTTSIYSKSDGVAAWQCCIDKEGPQAENIEVEGSHCGLGFNPLVLHAVLDRLVQPEGAWRPFDRSGARQLFYCRPESDPRVATAGNGHRR